MKFNPTTKTLLTNEGSLIKRLHCPFNVKWDALPSEYSTHRNCVRCGKSIIDTQFLDEKSVIEIVKIDPSACLKVSLDQSNIRVIHHNV